MSTVVELVDRLTDAGITVWVDGGESYTARALSGTGTIGGRPVRCIAAEELVGFHSDYELKEKDFRDVSALCEAFDIPLPAEYERFLE